jgi:hypothetical protein
MYLAAGEKRSASTGRCVFRKRRWVCASNRRQLHLLWRHAEVEPGRHGGDLKTLHAVEQKLAHDLLHPGGAGLAVGGDDDVVVAELQVVPDGGVEMVVVQLALLLRPGNLNLVHAG